MCGLQNNTIHKQMSMSKSFPSPTAVDFSQMNSLLYLADKSNVTLLNLNLETITSWPIPVETKHTSALKVDDKVLYLTMSSVEQIYVCQYLDGKVLQTYGKEKGGSLPGEFQTPCGLTCDLQNLYICDQKNHRIQILEKMTGNWRRQWGSNQGTDLDQFNFPKSIYLDIVEEIFYIGDSKYVRLFTSDGTLIDHMDYPKGSIFGICKLNENLFICENYNGRLQIYDRK